MKYFTAIIIFTLIVCSELNLAQSNEVKLVPSDSAYAISFGWDIAQDGNNLIISSPTDDTNDVISGSVYMFTNNGGNWEEHSKIVPLDGHRAAYFGWSVDIDNEYAVIGAFGDDENGESSGAAYVYNFEPDSNAWLFHSKLMASDGEQYDFFGIAVSIYGTHILVGAQADDSDFGSAYCFELEDTVWIEKSKLYPENPLGDAHFGRAIDMQGDYAVISSPQDDTNGHESGVAYIFHNESGQWVLQDKITANDIAQGWDFGNSVSIYEDYLLVGSRQAHALNIPQGAAYVFKREGTQWIQQQKLIDSLSSPGTGFGSSVCLYDDAAIIGKRNDFANGASSGAAYIFKFDGMNWNRHSKFFASDGETGDEFGGAVFTDGMEIFVGAPDQAVGGAYCGAVYAYDLVLTEVGDETTRTPSLFALSQNYPNPFNPTTRIKFTIPNSVISNERRNLGDFSSQAPRNDNVRLVIYDILGNKITTLFDEQKPPGIYEVEYNANGLSSGVYFYRLQFGEFIDTKKLLFLK